jgi:hypothetical protein
MSLVVGHGNSDLNLQSFPLHQVPRQVVTLVFAMLGFHHKGCPIHEIASPFHGWIARIYAAGNLGLSRELFA